MIAAPDRPPRPSIAWAILGLGAWLFFVGLDALGDILDRRKDRR